MKIAHNNVGNCLENLPWTEKDLMFFFNTSVACIINRTLRKHNTNKVKDSVIFFINQYFVLGGITPIDWDTGCAIFLGYFLAEK